MLDDFVLGVERTTANDIRDVTRIGLLELMTYEHNVNGTKSKFD